MKRIPPNDVSIGLHRDDLALSIAAFKQIVFDHRAAVTALRIFRIARGHQLHGLKTVALAFGDVAKMVMVNVVPLALVPNQNLEQLAVPRPIQVVLLLLEQAMINLDLATS